MKRSAQRTLPASAPSHLNMWVQRRSGRHPWRPLNARLHTHVARRGATLHEYDMKSRARCPCHEFLDRLLKGAVSGSEAGTGARGTRTLDLLHAMQTRSQLRHGPGEGIMSERGWSCNPGGYAVQRFRHWCTVTPGFAGRTACRCRVQRVASFPSGRRKRSMAIHKSYGRHWGRPLRR